MDTKRILELVGGGICAATAITLMIISGQKDKLPE